MQMDLQWNRMASQNNAHFQGVCITTDCICSIPALTSGSHRIRLGSLEVFTPLRGTGLKPLRNRKNAQFVSSPGLPE